MNTNKSETKSKPSSRGLPNTRNTEALQAAAILADSHPAALNFKQTKKQIIPVGESPSKGTNVDLHEEVGVRKLDYDGRKEVSIVMTPTQSITNTTRIAHPTTTSAAQPSKDQPQGEEGTE